MRTCSRCSRELDDSCFSINQGRPRTRCKSCEAEIRRIERREKNPEWFEDRALTAEGKRKCRRCGTLKPLADFPEDKGKHGGRRWQCADCSRALRADYYRQNAEIRRERRSDYRNRNRESVNAKLKQYYRDNREELLRKAQEYREANAAHYKEYEKKRRLDPVRREYSKKIGRLVQAKRRAAYHEPYSIEDLLNVLSSQKGRCIGCERSIRRAFTVDHIMPLSKGGADAIWNIQLLCKPCNQSKGAKHPDVWAAKLGRLFI